MKQRMTLTDATIETFKNDLSGKITNDALYFENPF